MPAEPDRESHERRVRDAVVGLARGRSPRLATARRLVKYVATLGGTSEVVEINGDDGHYQVTIGDRSFEVDGRPSADGIYSLLIGGVSYVADVFDGDGACVVDVGAERYIVRVEEYTRYIIRTKGGAAGGPGARTLVAPLPGRIVKVTVKPGDRVAGYLPNVPGAIIAMLAATRLGAVWSSCSPDFGVQGVLDRFGQIEPKVLFAADGFPTIDAPAIAPKHTLQNRYSAELIRNTVGSPLNHSPNIGSASASVRTHSATATSM